ncbi:MAG: FkbM family methyltransferase [Candidatus Aenigmarchaeota archaeon]|nr:FkbM family methyltransferase [Candidatus Aenigmarchaeota archaeon]
MSGRKINKIRYIGFVFFRWVCRKLQYSGLTKYKTVGKLYDKTFRFLHPFEISLENVGDHKMFLNLKDTTCQMMSMFDFEPETSKAIKENLKSGMTFFDIGAHVGYFTLLGAKYVGKKGKIYAFEPDTKNYDILKKNIKISGYNNVSLNQVAVSNKNGFSDMFLSRDSAFHSLKFNEGRGKNIVKTIKIDDFCKKNRIKKIDLVKLDIEGSEIDALEGMRNTIKKNKKMKLIVEYIPNNFRRIDSTPQKFVETLVSLGFNEFYLLYNKDKKLINPSDLIDVKNDIYNIVCSAI